MTIANDNDMTPQRRLQVLERRIERSQRELAGVEEALRAGNHPGPAKAGALYRRRLILLDLIEDMESMLKELRTVDGE